MVAAALGVLLVSGLTACGSDEQAQGEDIALVFENALTVCADMPNAPFAYSENNLTTGFDYDIASVIAEELDLSLDFIQVSGKDIASGAALNADRCDLGMSALAITGSRARVVDFSSPYFDSEFALVVAKDAEARTLEALAGQKVGVRDSSTTGLYLRDTATDIEVVAYPDAASLESAVAKGRVAAALMDAGAAKELTDRRSKMQIAETIESGEQYGIAVKKDGNLPLLRRVNSILADMAEDGTYDEIYKKYF
jgi:polar amino acid transport system substrate-binding protein